jgi:hypothetical protein
MEEIPRSKGTTKSERYLARLADRTFLNLWAYPNVHRDVLVNGHRTGKEICDLLVVCGNQVIIFSDKTVTWPKKNVVKVAWPRWYKKAVKKSVDQIRGAEGWIDQNPDRIFLDSTCTKNLPIKIPPKDTRKIHGVVVAHGAHEACSRFFEGDRGSFMVRPSLQGDAHMNPSSADFSPFTVGDVEPSGSFIHVLNEVTLGILMKELDTITDFVDYLEHKAVFARSGHLSHAAGEEELLAYYLTHMIDNDRHGFVHPQNRPWTSEEKFGLSTGHYEGLVENPQFISKKEADKNSYLWDRLIETFTNHMLAGTSLVPDGRPGNIAQIEIGVRYMAQEPRITRRLYGDAILKMLKVANQHDRYFQCMLPSQENPRHGTGYVFMTHALPKKDLNVGYEQYRQVRVNTLSAYCMGMLKRCRWVKRIIGIATEPPPTPGGPSDTSEDMGMAEQPIEWTPGREAEIDELCQQLDILQEDSLHYNPIGLEEYPKGPS